MKFSTTPLAGLVLVHPEPVEDARGRFERVFCDKEFDSLHADLHVAQANLSLTRGRGSLRGLHYQAAPHREAKLVRCLRGRAFDVAVDLRRDGGTFLQWFGVELSGANGLALFIPEGFAHGFQVLDDDAQMLYFHSTHWSPGSESGIRYDDPAIAVAWPLPVNTISARDLALPTVAPDFQGIQ